MFFSYTKWKAFGTRRSPGCLKLRKRLQRTRYFKQRKVCGRCWKLHAAAARREYGERHECHLWRLRANLERRDGRGMDRAGITRRQLRGLRGRAARLEVA